MSLCWIAAQEGHEACIRTLVELGADCQTADDFGWTPCFVAARNGHEACIRTLVELGADCQTADNFGRTPCCIAAQEGHEACIRTLVELGADCRQAANIGITPRATALFGGHQQVADFIDIVVQRIADVRAAATSGDSASAWALLKKNDPVKVADPGLLEAAVVCPRALLANQLRHIHAAGGYSIWHRKMQRERLSLAGFQWKLSRGHFALGDTESVGIERGVMEFVFGLRERCAPPDILGEILGWWSDLPLE